MPGRKEGANENAIPHRQHSLHRHHALCPVQNAWWPVSEGDDIPRCLYATAKIIDDKIRLVKVCGLLSEGVNMTEEFGTEFADTLRKTADYIVLLEAWKADEKNRIRVFISSIDIPQFLWFRFLVFLRGKLWPTKTL
jgi:hypothetical protein